MHVSPVGNCLHDRIFQCEHEYQKKLLYFNTERMQFTAKQYITCMGLLRFTHPTLPLIHLAILYAIEQFWHYYYFAYALLSLLFRFGLATLMSIRRSIEVMSRSCNMPLKNTSTPRPFVSMLHKAKFPGICHHTNAFSFKSTAPRKEP